MAKTNTLTVRAILAEIAHAMDAQMGKGIDVAISCAARLLPRYQRGRPFSDDNIRDAALGAISMVPIYLMKDFKEDATLKSAGASIRTAHRFIWVLKCCLPAAPHPGAQWTWEQWCRFEPFRILVEALLDAFAYHLVQPSLTRQMFFLYTRVIMHSCTRMMEQRRVPPPQRRRMPSIPELARLSALECSILFSAREVSRICGTPVHHDNAAWEAFRQRFDNLPQD